jgi:anti-sigma factor RsiW
MNAPFHRPDACEHAAQSLSLRLDGELSDLGSARLEAHLERCPACSALGLELGSLTSLVRAAPLEVPMAPLEVPRLRSARLRSLRQFRPAALVATMAAVAVFSVGPSVQRHQTLQPGPGSFLNEHSALAKTRLVGTQAGKTPVVVLPRDAERQRVEQLQIERGAVS